MAAPGKPLLPAPLTPAPPGLTPIEVAMPAPADCLASSGARAVPSATVHRWIDTAGITHYSDQLPPASAKDRRVITLRGLPPITVQATGYDVGLPDQLQQRAVADALGVQRVLRDALGVAAADAATLRVVFVHDASTYARLIGDPALATSAGAYSTAQHAIYVRLQEQDEASFAILRHEITHALLHTSVGNLPTALNEGLAEYFARYRTGGLGGQVDVGADRQQIVIAAPSGDGSDALVDLLAHEGADFYAGSDAGRVQRYLRAYSLVALLMQGGEGRAALGAVLSAQRTDPCRPIAAERVLDTHYRGGLPALATAWAAFMRAPPQFVQAW
ncbi:MAG: DUF4124 domain-containing protein [Lysobacterales bacterium]